MYFILYYEDIFFRKYIIFTISLYIFYLYYFTIYSLYLNPIHIFFLAYLCSLSKPTWKCFALFLTHSFVHSSSSSTTLSRPHALRQLLPPLNSVEEKPHWLWPTQLAQLWRLFLYFFSFSCFLFFFSFCFPALHFEEEYRLTLSSACTEMHFAIGIRIERRMLQEGCTRPEIDWSGEIKKIQKLRWKLQRCIGQWCLRRRGKQEKLLRRSFELFRFQKHC